MKATITVTTKKEVEIEFPFFFKSTGYYAMLSETSAISIYDNINLFSHASSISQNMDDENYKEITVEEFTLVYDAKIEQLQSLKSNFFTKQ